MFNKLVISNSERRKGRVIKFFCGTSLIYAVVIVGALALSVIISNPRLADTGEQALALLTPLPPPGPAAPRPRTNTPPTVQPRNDPNHIVDLDHVNNDASVKPRNVVPTGTVDFTGNSEPSGGDGPGINALGVPGSAGAGEPPAPQPVEPARPEPQPQASTPRSVRVSSSVLQGKAITRHKPDYPALARTIRLSGSVSVEVVIGLDGHVEAARAVSGHPLLVKAAVDAAYGWRFEPTLLNGTPVRVTGVIVFNFTMEG
jgi:periplasmic protein TonB